MKAFLRSVNWRVWRFNEKERSEDGKTGGEERGKRGKAAITTKQNKNKTKSIFTFIQDENQNFEVVTQCHAPSLSFEFFRPKDTLDFSPISQFPSDHTLLPQNKSLRPKGNPLLLRI